MYKWGKEDIFCLIKVRGDKGAEGLDNEMKVFIPKAVRCIEKDLEELLNFYYTPKELWVKLRTKRAFREVRRRTRPMSCFNNTTSIERIVYAVMSHLNDRGRIKPLNEFTQKS